MSSVPKIVFIVPYRNRDQQRHFFNRHMTYILEDMPTGSYQIYYIHQCDTRDFNRGAMKNIGFLFLRNKYPMQYKDITIVFNDVDTMPFTKGFLDYPTCAGVVKHFYGLKYALGGIVSITAGDFEKTTGFPNFWAWGFEDNSLQKRVIAAGLTIDRSQFYPIFDKNILQFQDGIVRNVNRTEFDRYVNNTTEGIHSIQKLEYDIDEETGMINVRTFSTGTSPDVEKNKTYDLRNGAKPFPTPWNKKNAMKMFM